MVNSLIHTAMPLKNHVTFFFFGISYTYKDILCTNYTEENILNWLWEQWNLTSTICLNTSDNPAHKNKNKTELIKLFKAKQNIKVIIHQIYLICNIAYKAQTFLDVK